MVGKGKSTIETSNAFVDKEPGQGMGLGLSQVYSIWR
jgi:hypothetical protein